MSIQKRLSTLEKAISTKLNNQKGGNVIAATPVSIFLVNSSLQNSNGKFVCSISKRTLTK